MPLRKCAKLNLVFKSLLQLASTSPGYIKLVFKGGLLQWASKSLEYIKLVFKSLWQWASTSLEYIKQHNILFGLLLAVVGLVVGLIAAFGAPEIRPVPDSLPTYKASKDFKRGNPTEMLMYITRTYKNYSFFREGYIDKADVVQQNLKGRVGVEIVPEKKNVISPRGERTVTLQLRVLIDQAAWIELYHQGHTAQLKVLLYDNTGRPIEVHPGHTDELYIAFTLSDQPDRIPVAPIFSSPH